MGIRKVVCVGIDGGQKHAIRNQWRTRLQNDHWRTYARIRQSFIARAKQLEIELEFFGAEQTPEAKRGNMKILITRNTSTRGIPLMEGEVVELETSEANLIVGCGKAVPAPSRTVQVDETPPAQSMKAASAEQVETADAPENRTANRKRRSTKK